METATLKALIPYVNDEEMQEISEKFGTPDDYNEDDFVDMTDWLNDEN